MESNDHKFQEIITDELLKFITITLNLISYIFQI